MPGRLLLTALLLATPGATVLLADEGADTDRTAADIGLLSDGGRPVRKITTPPGFEQGDELIAYEGPGWESRRVAFRLYLDGRNALDVFGKKSPALILSQTGRGDDYHQMNDWGMDILKVGASLGAGGLGVYENGRVRQVGRAAHYRAEVAEDTDAVATVRITHINSSSCEGNMTVEYTIEAGQRVTNVRVLSACALPLAAGLVIHPDTERFTSESSTDDWQFVARYGKQSLADDGLGLALFYRESQVAETGQDADDDYIVFKRGVLPEYKTAAAWVQEADGLRDVHAFENWLRHTLRTLNGAMNQLDDR